MNSIDWVIFIPVMLGFVFGLFKGLVKELASLAAIVLGIYGAKLFSPVVAVFLHQFFTNYQLANVFAYVIVFIAIAVVLLIIARWLDKFFDAVSLSMLNKIGGGLFGALKFALIMSVLLNVFDAIDSKFVLVEKETKQNSLFYKPVKNLGPQLWNEARTLHQNSIEDENE